jgi:hypothetical protein
MSKNNSAWSSLMKNYYSNKVATNKHKLETNTNYGEVLDAMYGKLGDKKTEELVEEVPSRIVVDEEVEKYVEKHIVDEFEQLIETGVDAYEAAIAAGGQQIELQETQETYLVDGPTPRPVEEPDFTAEELEEFMRLNKIEKLHEIVEPTPVELESNEVIVTEQPTETKVKKVKVSKPKAPKKAGRPKAKK